MTKNNQQNKLFQKFHEVCENLGLTSEELHDYVQNESIVPAIFYHLGFIPEKTIITEGDKTYYYSKRDLYPNLPELSQLDDIAYLHGALKTGANYKFAHLAFTPNYSKSLINSHQIAIESIDEAPPHSKEDAEEHFIFVNEEVKRFCEIHLPKSPKVKVNKNKVNQLHTLIWKVDNTLTELNDGIRPQTQMVWNTIERNYNDYDDEAIIQEVKDNAIFWKSKNGIEQTLTSTSFPATLSSIRNKNKNKNKNN